MPKLPRVFLGASIAVAGLLTELVRKTDPFVLNADVKLEPPLPLNPAWVTAPYDVSFMFGGGHYRTSTRRKTWLKARRRWKKALKKSLWPAPIHEGWLKPEDWQGEVEFQKEFHQEMTAGLLLNGFPMARLLTPDEP